MSRNNGSAVTLSDRLVTQVFKETKGQDRRARKLSPTQLKMEKELHPLLGEIWRDMIYLGEIWRDGQPPSEPSGENVIDGQSSL